MKKAATPPALLLLLSVVVTIFSLSCSREPASTPGEASSSASTSPPAPTGPPAVPDGLTSLSETAFRVEWGNPKLSPALRAGQSSSVTVLVKNTGDEQWPSKGSLDPSWAGAGAVRLSYRWLKPSSDPLTSFTDRVDLPKALGPGESAELVVPVKTPGEPGDYKLQFDLVQESVAWFSDKGAAKLAVPVKIQ